MLYPSSFEFFEKELRVFGSTLEELTGEKLTQDRLRHAIKLHNINRSLIRDLYSLRRQHPPLISGTEMTKLLVSGMGSFTVLLNIRGILITPLLSGILPILLVRAGRQKGEFTPDVDSRLLRQPIIIKAIRISIYCISFLMVILLIPSRILFLLIWLLSSMTPRLLNSLLKTLRSLEMRRVED